MRFYFTTTNNTLGIWCHRSALDGYSSAHGAQLFRLYVSAYSDKRPDLIFHCPLFHYLPAVRLPWAPPWWTLRGHGLSIPLPSVRWRYESGRIRTLAWRASESFWWGFRRLAKSVQNREHAQAHAARAAQVVR